MATWRRDLIFAFRRFCKSPGFVFAVMVSIGLGIGANGTIFSVVHTFLLRPPAAGNPATLMSVFTTQHGECCGNNLSWPLYADLRDQTRLFSGITAFYASMPTSIGGHGEAERVWGGLAEYNFFDVTQLPMSLGRGFLRSEEQLPVVVLSHRLWRDHFAGDAGILGKSVSISAHPFTVIGVAPASFRGLDCNCFWKSRWDAARSGERLFRNGRSVAESVTSSSLGLARVLLTSLAVCIYSPSSLAR
jgi:MacB-like periplasmic core domain